MAGTAKLLLFDVDGTLILSGGAGLRSVNRAFMDLFGLRDAMATCHPDGKTDPAIFSEVARAHLKRDLSDSEKSAVAGAYLEALRGEVSRSPGYEIMPGVTALLEALSSDGRLFLGLATGNLEAGARIKLGRAGLDRYFAFGGYGSDDERRDRLVAIAITRGQRVAGRDFPPEDIIVIGDTTRDIDAARAVGVRALVVPTGSTPVSDLAGHNPDAILDDLSDVEAFLSAIA